jgi:adenosylcobinamide-phosphate synthase
VHQDSRVVGALYAAGLTGGAGLLGAALAHPVRRPGGRVALTALATWAVVGGTTLRREAAALHALLAVGDVDGARARLPHLCGRDPAALDVPGLARATVESVAENTSDAVVGPLFWGAVAGVPGLLAYRAVNTLDAMVGHRSERYRRFGWAAARLDDAANLVPARVTAALTVALAPVVDGRPQSAWRAWRRDGAKHPSPNAGPVEAAFAGALGRTLGGRLSYAGRVEDRPLLGDGPAPTVADIARAARLSAAVSLAAGAAAVAVRGLRQ